MANLKITTETSVHVFSCNDSTLITKALVLALNLTKDNCPNSISTYWLHSRFDEATVHEAKAKLRDTKEFLMGQLSKLTNILIYIDGPLLTSFDRRNQVLTAMRVVNNSLSILYKTTIL